MAAKPPASPPANSKDDDSDGEGVDEKEFQADEKKKAIQERIFRAREEQQARETKALLAWANILLKQRGLKGTTLSHYHDGVLLINLLEVAFGEPIGRYVATPKLSIQKHENVNKGFKKMDDLKIPYPSVDSHHIVESQSKQIVVVLWNILRCYMIRGLKKGGDVSDGAMRTHLLEYVNANVKDDVKVPVENFGSQFRDGIILCSLVNQLVPGTINVKELKSTNGASNLALAFKVAEDNLGIPPTLDAKKFASGEEGTDDDMLKYIAMLVAAAQARKKLADEDAKRKAALETKETAEARQLAAIQELEKKKAEEKIRFEELQAKLKVDLEEAEAKEREAKKAAHDDELARLKLLVAEQNRRIRELELRNAELESRTKNCGSEKAELHRTIEALQANTAWYYENHSKEVGEVTAQLYTLHREHEDVLTKVREDNILRETEIKKEEEPFKRKRRHYSKDFDKKEKKEEWVLSMKDHGATLLRRRPNSFLNRKRFKVLYYKLTGEKLFYFDQEGGKQKGVFFLKEFLYAEASSTQGDRFSFRMLPGPKAKPNNLIELKQLQGEEDDNDAFIKKWFYEVNRRIALIHYLKEIEEHKQPGCDELLDFCMSDNAQTLEIEHDRLVGFHEALKSLKRAIMYRPNLKRIVLDSIEVDDAIAITLAEILTYSEAIEKLELPNNKITAAGCEAFAAALRKNQSLSEIDLANNALKDKGVKALVSCLPDHPKLRKLGLTGNGVTDEGIEAIIKGLAESEKENGKPHNMPTLDLTYNLIGDHGAKRIADLCKVNPFIATINLEHNLITDKGCMELASIVSPESKAQVTTLNLANNQLTSQGLIALSEALKRTYYALTVDVSYNRLITRSGLLSITTSDLSLDWILLKVRSQVSSVEAANPPPPSAAQARLTAQQQQQSKTPPPSDQKQQSKSTPVVKKK